MITKHHEAKQHEVLNEVLNTILPTDAVLMMKPSTLMPTILNCAKMMGTATTTLTMTKLILMVMRMGTKLHNNQDLKGINSFKADIKNILTNFVAANAV